MEPGALEPQKFDNRTNIQIWTELLNQTFEAGKGRFERQIATHQFDGIGEVQEVLFVEKLSKGINDGFDIGGKLISNKREISRYFCAFYLGIVNDVQVWVAESHIVNTGNMGVVSGPLAITRSVVGFQMGLEYDAQIIQIAANTLGKPVIHSITITALTEEIVNTYISFGYGKIGGHFGQVYKTFIPDDIKSLPASN